MFTVVALVVSLVLVAVGVLSLLAVGVHIARIGTQRATAWVNRTGTATYLPPGSR